MIGEGGVAFTACLNTTWLELWRSYLNQCGDTAKLYLIFAVHAEKIG